jgi:hypothetical protein
MQQQNNKNISYSFQRSTYNPNNYGRALLSAITPNPHTNLLNVYVQIAHKMGFQSKELTVF